MEFVKNYAPWAFGVIAFISIFIEITPIKFSPISILLNWIGTRANVKTTEQLEKINNNMKQFEKELENIKSDSDKTRIKDLRFTIIDFSDSLRTRNHSKSAYEHIMEAHDEYLSLLENYNMSNGVTDEAYKYITEKYRECLKENKFI